MVAPPPNRPASPAMPSYPRPPLLGSPVRNRWGVGKLSTKPGEVYIGAMGGAQKNVPLAAFSTPGAYASLSPPAQKALYAAMEASRGYSGVPQGDIDGFLEKTVANAYAVQQTTGLLIDPLSYWDYYKMTGGPGLKDFGAEGAGGAGGGGGGTSRSVNESVNLSDPSTARGLIDSTISRYLGRNPTDKEYSTFAAALNAQENKSPSVTESVTTSGGGSSRTKSTTRSGMDRSQFAVEYAKSLEGVAELSAATTGLDAFMDAIGGV